MIQIYRVGNTNYEKNGDMTLFPISAIINAKLNGEWEAEIEHPIDSDGRWKYIEDQAVVKMPSFLKEDQLFRIKQRIKKDSNVTAVLEPIFYDAIDDCFLIDVRPTAKNGQEALDIMTAANKKYKGSSNITKATTAYYEYMNLLEAINGDSENSFLNRWGGEILYNNFEIIVNQRVGGNYGIKICYGKNIKQDGLEEKIDTSEIVTRIFPKAYNGYKMSGSGYIDSPLLNNYPTPKIRTITFSDVKMREDAQEDDEEKGVIICDTQLELDAALTKRCIQQYNDGLDKPKVTISVDVILLKDTELYKDYAPLEEISLGDDVSCVHNKLNVATNARVIQIKYNSIKRRVEEVVLGDYQSDFIDNITSTTNKIDSVVRSDGTLMAERVQGILNGIYTQLKLQSTVAKKVQGRAFVVEDTDIESSLYGCMVWGTQGLQIAVQRTADGRDWDFTTAITAKGIVADAIITGILSDKTGKNFWNLDTGEFQLTSQAFLVDGETVKDYINSEIDNKIPKTQLLTIHLSNDFQGISTDSGGENGSFTNCYTDVKVFLGAKDVTNDTGVLFTFEVSSGVTGEWNNEIKRYQVINMTTDNGSVKITVTYSNMSVSKTFSIAKSKSGENGRVYLLHCNTLIIKQNPDASYSPSEIEFSSYYRDGTSAIMIPYLGRFKIEESINGIDYITRYTSSEDEKVCTYTLTNASIYSIRCTMYMAGGTTVALDVQTLTIVQDAKKLTQSEVFNILTNDGKLQGIFMKDGKLYINGSYISISDWAELSKTLSGFKLSTKRIYGQSDKYCNGISTGTDDIYCFWAGETNGKLGDGNTDAPFLVSRNGTVWSKRLYAGDCLDLYESTATWKGTRLNIFREDGSLRIRQNHHDYGDTKVLIEQQNGEAQLVFPYASSNHGTVYFYSGYNSRAYLGLYHAERGGSGGAIFRYEIDEAFHMIARMIAGQIECTSLTQTSSEKIKKNIEELDKQKALDLIRNTKIYQYFLREQKDEDGNIIDVSKKQQFGAVIEKGCPDEFVSDDGESINLYSMIATCIAAIQKQQEEIDILKKGGL